MSKKKGTMTLKDFHGGSIPSDLQLPSAPGMTVDRNVWSSNGPLSSKAGAYHHRQPLLNTPNGSRSYDFPSTMSMGRNYDEDERRPVDFRPRSSPAAHHDYRYDAKCQAAGGSRSYSPSDYDNGRVYYKGRSPDDLHYSPFPQAGGRFGQLQPVHMPATPTTPPEQQPQQHPPLNAWTARRGEHLDLDASASSPWRVRNSMARIAEASAIDKVSSGRWQPASSVERDTITPRKEPVYDVDARKVETLQLSHTAEQQDVDGTRVAKSYQSCRQAQPADGSYCDIGRDAPEFEQHTGVALKRGGYPACSDGDRTTGLQRDDAAGSSRAVYDCLEVHYTRSDDDGPSAGNIFERESTDSTFVRERLRRPKSSDLENNRTSGDAINQEFLSGTTHSDLTRAGAALLRPKLKLLPRSKPADDRYESYEPNDHPEAGRQQQLDSRGILHTEHDICRPVERPKLSLKPRSHVTEIAGSEKERRTLFGGARPREMVLKERGTEECPVDVASDGNELIRSEKKGPVTNSEGRESDSRQQDSSFNKRQDGGKQGNRREDSVRNDGDMRRQDAKRDIDKQESWRRPASPTPALSALAEVPPRVAGKAYGSSALQLAQAFSRSTTISAAGSRLMDTSSPRYGQQQRKHNAATAW